MTDEDLIRLAQEHHVGTRYLDWRGRPAQVSPDTIRAVLAALGVDASVRKEPLPPVVVARPGGLPIPGDVTEVVVELDGGGVVELRPPFRLPEETPLGWHRLRVRQGSYERSAALLVAPPKLPEAPRAWGLMTQLYSLRSAGSWGLGDLRDLADLAAWSGRALGSGFVLVNPLHATEPAPPIGPSPYSPMSRRYTSPLYLRVEDVPEFEALGKADREYVTTLAGPPRESVHTLEPLDRDAVWTAKRAALELLFRGPRTAARQAAYEAFKSREGEPLTAFATWCALAEEHGNDWRRWPGELQDAGGAAVARARERLADRVEFHAWLQWQLDEQLAAAQAAARDAGMPVGIIHDLAVGVSHAGADAWMYRPVFAQGMSVGAPPDEFNQRGQDWGQPPWHPGRLAAAEYRPYRRMLAGALRHGGGLRLDHAMQVSRLWWVPEGASPAEGTYVAYDRPTMLAILAWEAHRHDALVIGEDLGTVEPEVREDLAERGILGTSLLWFERDAKGHPLPPARWRRLSLATVGTHDMPPIRGVLHGDHIELRDRLGLLTRPVAEERAEHREQLAGWLGLLAEEGLLTTGHPADDEVVAALHALLARTPAQLVGVSLADAVGERRTQNQPGTVDEYPNWRVPLADAEGRPVLLEDLSRRPAVSAAVDPVRGRGPR